MLRIESGNIFDYIEQVDAIVNSNNQYMMFGSGMCGSLYKLAGKQELEQYCKDNFNKVMKTNEVRVTPGFNLEKDIIHIYAPKYHEDKRETALIDSYRSIFMEASEKGYKTILSVSIGTGIHGYIHEEIAGSVISTIQALTEQCDIDFILVLPNEEIREIYRKHLFVSRTMNK